jgi:hypothetical protein
MRENGASMGFSVIAWRLRPPFACSGEQRYGFDQRKTQQRSERRTHESRMSFSEMQRIKQATDQNDAEQRKSDQQIANFKLATDDHLILRYERRSCRVYQVASLITC